MATVCMIYPVDPLGVAPSGIDTFIDGLIRWSPGDFELRLVGVTTDPDRRPAGRWNRCALNGRTFEFFPLFALTDRTRRPKIPVTLRFMFALATRRPRIEADVLEFHRVEPVLVFLRDRRVKTCFQHQDMAVLYNEHADIRWKYAPRAYFALEGLVVRRLSKLFCVREDAALAYRERYPECSDRFEFVPTWVDPLLFYPVEVDVRRQLRVKLANSVGIGTEDDLLVSVGRLDHQKDPVLLIDAFRLLLDSWPSARLVVIGDGVLRPELERAVQRGGLRHAVKLIGLQPKLEIADWLRAVDVFVLSSAYEGMPMAVLEALGSGLPVASTDVGEVRRVVRPGVNGELVSQRTPEELAAAISRCLEQRDTYAGTPCTSAVAEYSPKKVVERIYGTYRELLSPRTETLESLD